MNPGPKYSICVINMNTEATLEVSLRSVLSQLDSNFEVVVVDESSDRSRNILTKLQIEFPIIRNIFLEEDKKRTIGDARNISIQEARGEYCIMHIDCDDYWFPYLLEFIAVFEELERVLGKDMLVAGHQINVAKRSFLLTHGPYRNVEHGEDRDLWMRLAKLGLYQPLDHVPFFKRMDIGVSKVKKKALLRTYWSVRDEVRGGIRFNFYVKQLFTQNLVSNMKTRLLRVALYPLAYISARSRPSLVTDSLFKNPDDWNRYKMSHNGLLFEIASRYNKTLDLNFLTPQGRWIFSNRRGDKSIEDLPDNLQKKGL